MKRHVHDLAEMKQAYITGTETTPALAERYGVPYPVVRERCRREGWVEMRKDFRRQREDAARAKAAKRHGKELALYTDKMLDLSGRLEGVIAALVDRLSDEGLDEIAQGRNPGRELESLSRALDTIDALKRRLYGTMDVRDARRLDLDREKLELEKRKFDSQQAAEHEIVVRIEGSGSEGVDV